MEDKGRFFTKEKYENELNQLVNNDVLERIKNDPEITSDEMTFSFYFITDKKAKIESLIDYLKKIELSQNTFVVNKIKEDWELKGKTYPIKLEIDSINKWEREMWDIGYHFDCELDGWETTQANKYD